MLLLETSPPEVSSPRSPPPAPRALLHRGSPRFLAHGFLLRLRRQQQIVFRSRSESDFLSVSRCTLKDPQNCIGLTSISQNDVLFQGHLISNVVLSAALTPPRLRQHNGRRFWTFGRGHFWRGHCSARHRGYENFGLTLKQTVTLPNYRRAGLQTSEKARGPRMRSRTFRHIPNSLRVTSASLLLFEIQIFRQWRWPAQSPGG